MQDGRVNAQLADPTMDSVGLALAKRWVISHQIPEGRASCNALNAGRLIAKDAP